MAKGTKISTVLFGVDGVIVDTESYYDNFWNTVAKDAGLEIDNFASVIRGMTLNSIIELYFPISPLEEKQALKKACIEMEQSIDYTKILLPGILDFIKYLKQNDYRIGIVTSSPSSKVSVLLQQLELEGLFDTIITSDNIKKGKPDPMGFVLAQTNLGVQSNQCTVFEDSFAGIKAAIYAFTRVIGVSTTLADDFLKDYTYGVIKDFSDLEQLKLFI